MMGTVDNPGVNRRCVTEILKVCKERQSVDFVVKVSLMEIYNEKFVDLLSDLPVDRQECELRMDPKTKAGYVTNLTERVVQSPEDVVKTLADGEVNRSTASTKMNSVSSRSHLLLTLIIEGHDAVSGQKSVGKLTMVDLAGSERISKTEATGQRLVEAAAINKSLSALGQVSARAGCTCGWCTGCCCARAGSRMGARARCTGGGHRRVYVWVHGRLHVWGTWVNGGGWLHVWWWRGGGVSDCWMVGSGADGACPCVWAFWEQTSRARCMVTCTCFAARMGAHAGYMRECACGCMCGRRSYAPMPSG
jgi:hypothetical protein